MLYSVGMSYRSRYLTTEEVAKILGFTVKSVRRKCQNGEIDARKWQRQYRIHPDEIGASVLDSGAIVLQSNTKQSDSGQNQ